MLPGVDMELSRKKISSFLLILLSVISTGSFFALKYQGSAINRALIVVQLALLLALAVLNEVFDDRGTLAVVLLNICSVLVTLGFHSGTGAAMIIICVLVVSFSFNNMFLDERNYVIIHSAVAGIILVFLATLTVDRSSVVQYKFYSFGYSVNTNAVGIIEFGLLAHLSCVLEKIKLQGFVKNLIYIPLAGFTIYMIYVSGCRSALVAATFFALLFIIPYRAFCYKNYYFIVFCIVVLSFVFALIYIFYAEEWGIENIGRKSALTRLGVWKDAIRQIFLNPFFGSGTDYAMDGYESAHNSMLDVLKNFGIIPTVSYVFCIVKRQAGNKAKEYSKVAQAAFLCGLIITFFESYYMSSFFCIPFLLFLINTDCTESGESKRLRALAKETR